MPRAPGKPPTKLAQVRAAMAAGDWALALRIAARFQDLGKQRDAILSAHGAHTNPRFYKQIGQDLVTLKRRGREALIERFGPPPRRHE